MMKSARYALCCALLLCALAAQGQSARPARALSEPLPAPSLTAGELKYQQFFRDVAALDQVHGGKEPGALKAMLVPEQMLLVKLVAAHCARALNENAVAARREFGEFRAAYSAGSAMRISPQLRREHEEQAKRIVTAHMQQLREMLGAAAFAKLDAYVQSRPGLAPAAKQP